MRFQSNFQWDQVLKYGAQRLTRTVSRPINALYRDSSGSYVYLNEDGERKRVAVTVGIQTDTVAEIKEGLQEGDEIYVKE